MRSEMELRRSISWGVLLAMAFGAVATAQPVLEPRSSRPYLSPIEFQVSIRASRQRAYRAWTDSKVLSTWFAPAQIEARPGGMYEIYIVRDAEYGVRGSEGCRVLSLIPNRMLTFEWSAPPKFGDAYRAFRSHVTLTFERGPELTTTLRLRHYGWPFAGEFKEVRAYFEQVWPPLLERVKEFVENHDRDAMDALPDVEVPAHPERQFVYYIHPTDPQMMAQPSPEQMRAMQAHARYVLQGLVAQGRLYLAGPTMGPKMDPEGEKVVPLEMKPPGVVVFKAFDEADARRIMNADPAVQAGVFSAVCYEGRVSYAR